MVLTHIVLSRNVQQAQGLKKPIYQSLTNCKCPSICFIPRTYRCVGYCAHWGCCHPSYWECLWHSWASPLPSERQGWSFTAWSQLWWGSACLSVCLPVCLSVCLPVCLPVSLPVCLPACLPVCLPVCLGSLCSVHEHQVLKSWTCSLLSLASVFLCVFLEHAVYLISYLIHYLGQYNIKFVWRVSSFDIAWVTWNVHLTLLCTV